MNSNYGGSRSTQSGFDFDLGIGSNRSKSLHDQKNKSTSVSYSSSSSFPSSQPKPNPTSSWQPNKPSWTHQPAPTTQSSRPGSLTGPTSMVGDITGRSWASSAPPSATATGIGIVNKNPNLFSDLLGPNLGQNKGSSGSVPLKNAAPVSAQASNRNAYSMGSMADSLPSSGNSAKSSGGIWGSSTAESFGSFHNATTNNNKNQNLGGSSMKSSGGFGIGDGGINSTKDPFGSLVDFSSKPAAASIKPGSKENIKTKPVDEAFGDFQNASKSSANAFPTNTSPMASNLDDFGFSNMQSQQPARSTGVEAFDALFSSSLASAGNAAKAPEDFGSQQFSGAEDWGFESDFGGGGDVGGTTELDGLPPPPAGFTASSAKNKGMDNYKQGQYPDAIKWLSWAVILLEKAGDNAGAMGVLSSRASCYKEVGEYKKAVADCTKVLAQDDTNVSVLVQRALLYESMEKYKLSAEDLRTVMKLEPGNRVARSTIHRVAKMAD